MQTPPPPPSLNVDVSLQEGPQGEKGLHCVYTKHVLKTLKVPL